MAPKRLRGADARRPAADDDHRGWTFAHREHVPLRARDYARLFLGRGEVVARSQVVEQVLVLRLPAE